MAPSAAIETAMSHLRRGDIPAASSLVEAVLAVDPANAEALHLLGTIKTQGKDLPGALDLFQRALAADSSRAAYWFSRGTALKQLGRYDDALTDLDQALARDARHPLAHCVRGDILSALGRPADALASFDRALALEPRLLDAQNNRGNELRTLGRHAEAIAAYDRVLSVAPRHAAAIVNRANALFELRRFDEALAGYRKALQLLPHLPQIQVRAGDSLQALDRFEEALACHAAAVAMAPDLVQAANGRAAALLWLRRLDEAEAEARRAMTIDASYGPTYNTMGLIHREQGRLAESAEILQRAVDLQPESAEAHYNLAQTLLLDGQIGPRAWREHEYRLGVAQAQSTRPDIPTPLWTGEPIKGKRVLVYAEQGLGDSLQFFPLLKLLRQRGADVVFLAPQRLVRLLRPSADGIEIVASPPQRPADVMTPLLSLPLRLGLTLETIPHDSPYLAAELDLAALWRERLASHEFKIGIAWQGSTGTRIDIGRSFPLAALAPLAGLPGVRLVSLQKGAGSEQIANLDGDMTVETLAGFDEGPDAFVDTAAVMQSLDLIVTSDTAIAHLAGALGRPVWLALQASPDWRWMLHRADTPWYPTMTLFRQTRRGDWTSVFADMAAALPGMIGRRQSARPAPLVPVSWGELADKISILQIKSERLTSPAQRANVARELDALCPAIDTMPDAPDALTALRADLKAINEKLWDIEDAIRAKDAAGAFDDEFTALARAVYETNDERGRLKRRINDLLGSELTEEKQYHPYSPAAAKDASP